jgi:TolB-like protein/DNA-binding winged helix-turn-helix (wHTH) protein
MLSAIHAFDGYRLDTARRTLTSPDGAAVKLTGKPFDALAYLLEHAGQVVDRTTLVQVLWSRRIVEDNNLNQAIAAIRRAIGDEHIVTVAGRGYQFVTPVSDKAVLTTEDEKPNSGNGAPSVELPTEPPAAPRRWRIFAAVVGIAGLAVAGIASFGVRDPAPRAGARPSIAVLPLENLSPDPDRAYVAFGFHEAIIGRLYDFGFDVRPRGAVRQYVPGATPPLAEISRDLDVDSVMEGMIRYADGRLRISLTLVSTADGKTLWHDEFDREFADLFTIESEVARNVADALEETLTPQQLAAAEQGYTQDPDAYDLYLTAMDHERRSIFNRDFVIAQYERATQIDPKFSLAWTRLALAKLTKRRWIAADPELLPSAREAAERALEITPDLALAKIALAYHRYLDGADRREILRDLEAVEGKSQRLSEFFALRADVYSELGLHEQHLADRNQVVILDPRNVPRLLGNGEANLFFRRYDEAQALFDRARDLEPNDIGMIIHRSSLPLYRDGDPRALRELEARMLSGEMPPAALVAWAAIYDGDYDAAVRLMSLLPELPSGSPGDFQRPLLLGQAHHFAGRDDEARGLFATALERIEAHLATAPPARRPTLEIARGTAKLGLGEPAAAIEHIYAALNELHLAPSIGAVGLRADAIVVLAGAGAVEPSLAELDTYLAGPGRFSLEGLLPHPFFDRIRSDPRFAELVSKHPAADVRVVATEGGDEVRNLGAR